MSHRPTNSYYIVFSEWPEETGGWSPLAPRQAVPGGGVWTEWRR